jgi:hypothetical protein
MEFCLTQMGGVRNYTDKKNHEFEQRVEELQQEYQRYLRKLRYLESEEGESTTSNQVRVYISKKRRKALQGDGSVQADQAEGSWADSP